MTDLGRSAADAASGHSGQAPEPQEGLGHSASVPNAADFPDARPIFEARRDEEEPWIYEVWDIEHPATCNHFPVLRVDSKGAADDLHFEVARICAEALNAKYAAGANRSRREEASAIEARRAETQGGSAAVESVAPQDDAQ